ncbi:hypothetical protein J2T60_002489 [Natronospira proteinivora]|uniref:Amidinotransferase n=1 Tax=Natronospira proteinivora TaxID=1807133 RepID=A0ABT1GAY2_9GAMM|nr:arginine deiminase-related protein [Natronospira proteinivora]MCP1728489.1 hypothetical protein [Natronospira proteinivora]
MSSEAQITDSVIMIRPASFTSNPETAASNSFQAELGEADPAEVRVQAQREFAHLADALEAAGVRVFRFEDTPEPETPDALFPNNWLSTHADGVAILYPMEAPSRRTERRRDILDTLSQHHSYHCQALEDLSHYEEKARYLEGTGSLILDRVNRIAYACLSSRTHPALFHDWCERFDYEPEAFTARNEGQEIYHTNVMMCLGEHFAVICDEAIEDEQERIRVLSRLEKTGHQVISITLGQMNQFAGNMLQLKSGDGTRVIAMSDQALECLSDFQRQALESHGRIVSADIRTIETYAGGSVRCMLAENFLPR